MQPVQQQKHRAGVLKQQNKAHKHGHHRSKGAIDGAAKGRVPVKVATKRNRNDLRRQDRRNQASQIRARKREETLARKRSLGGQGTPPFLTAIIPLCASEDAARLVNLFKSCDDEATVTENTQNHVHISIPRYKQRFTFCVPPAGDLYAVLDVAKVADTILFLLSPDEGTDAFGETVLASLFGQGLPATVLVVHGVENSVKKKNNVKRNLTKALEKWFRKDEKLNFVEKASDALLVLRQICTQEQHSLSLRDKRSHLLAEGLRYEAVEGQIGGTLQITGYVRGQPLSVNGLVHIPGCGDYQVDRIDLTPDPHPLAPRAASTKHRRKDSTTKDDGTSDTMEETSRLLARADPALQESLESENAPDAMDGEQTWPTEEELKEAEEANKAAAKKSVKRVPKGTSDYQAAWIVDGDEEEDDDDEYESAESEPEDVVMKIGGLDLMEAEEDAESDDDGEGSRGAESEEYETMTVTDAGDATKYDDKFDAGEEDENLEKFRAARMDAMFPDEIDTPQDMPARVRFQKFRGLKSFRTSPWDAKENLPSDYARIFQFENFARTKKRVLSEERDGAMPGWYVTLHIKDVPKFLVECHLQNSRLPLVVYQPLPHEQKMSVLNMTIRRTRTGTEETIKSKERLIFHVGYRRFCACPIFSQHTNSSKHKYERFLPSDAAVVATLYAPIVFPPASVLVFKEQKDGSHDLVATGTLMSVNPNRIVAKRVALSGHPFKINKRLAVVRYMFFSPEDIIWFKPVELRTKYGRRGHIKEPLGTHGHMKCFFDGQLKSQDTILMNLYKRVYPKWTYDAAVVHPTPMYRTEDHVDDRQDAAIDMM